jgi:hypothetical protein
MTRTVFLDNISLSNITIEKNPNAVPPSKPGDPHGYLLKNFTIRDGLVVESMVIGITEKKNCIKLMIYEVSLLDPPAGTPKDIKKLMINELEEFFDM